MWLRAGTDDQLRQQVLDSVSALKTIPVLSDSFLFALLSEKNSAIISNLAGDLANPMPDLKWMKDE